MTASAKYAAVAGLILTLTSFTSLYATTPAHYTLSAGLLPADQGGGLSTSTPLPSGNVLLNGSVNIASMLSTIPSPGDAVNVTNLNATAAAGGSVTATDQNIPFMPPGNTLIVSGTFTGLAYSPSVTITPTVKSVLNATISGSSVLTSVTPGTINVGLATASDGYFGPALYGRGALTTSPARTYAGLASKTTADGQGLTLGTQATILEGIDSTGTHLPAMAWRQRTDAIASAQIAIYSADAPPLTTLYGYMPINPGPWVYQNILSPTRYTLNYEDQAVDPPGNAYPNDFSFYNLYLQIDRVPGGINITSLAVAPAGDVRPPTCSQTGGPGTPIYGHATYQLVTLSGAVIVSPWLRGGSTAFVATPSPAGQAALLKSDIVQLSGMDLTTTANTADPQHSDPYVLQLTYATTAPSRTIPHGLACLDYGADQWLSANLKDFAGSLRPELNMSWTDFRTQHPGPLASLIGYSGWTTDSAGAGQTWAVIDYDNAQFAVVIAPEPTTLALLALGTLPLLQRRKRS